MRDHVLGFSDKVCIYLIEEEFFDRFFTIGLQRVKEPPVEAKQPPPATLESVVGGDCLMTSSSRYLTVFQFSVDSAFGLFFPDIGAFVEVFFAFSDGKSELQ